MKRDVVEKLKTFNAGRNPAVLPLKYNAMKHSAFRFFRGTCHLFYEDMPDLQAWNDATKAWICGDLHLENFGTYKGDNGLVYFDVNDFDEAILAPLTWELSRTVTSIFLAGDDLQLPAVVTKQMAAFYLDRYIDILSKGKALVIERPTATGIVKDLIVQVGKRTNAALMKERTVKKGKQRSLMIDNKRTMALPENEKEAIAEYIKRWSSEFHNGKYIYVDASMRIAGTGSIGINRYVILAQKKKDKDFVLLDMKQALPSSLKSYVHVKQPSWKNDAERVATIQKMMQFVPPALLEPVQYNHHSFVIKQLQPMADKMDFTLCRGKKNKLETVLSSMALAAASSLLRSTGRKGSATADAIMQFATAQHQWKKELFSFSEIYAKQVKKDYDKFLKSDLVGKTPKK
ncbi:MAG: DUF2252 family protein [Bacteroidota bacterium]|nr:DUF2252 family protein [Bacteroidota bacterium]